MRKFYSQDQPTPHPPVPPGGAMVVTGLFHMDQTVLSLEPLDGFEIVKAEIGSDEIRTVWDGKPTSMRRGNKVYIEVKNSGEQPSVPRIRVNTSDPPKADDEPS